MAYELPALNSVNFELSEYTVPALNSVDFSLGDEPTTITKPANAKIVIKPTAQTLPATNITTNSATLKGKVTNDGGESCEAKFRYRKV